MNQHVIARAFRGEPLNRVVVEVGDRVIYIAAPNRLDAVNAGESEPVGFPREDVFLFDSDTYRELRDQWEAASRTEPATWQRLHRFSS